MSSGAVAYFCTFDPNWTRQGATVFPTDPAVWLIFTCSGILFDCPTIQSPGNPDWNMGTGPVTVAGPLYSGAPGVDGYATIGNMRVGSAWSLFATFTGPADRRLIEWAGGLILGNLYNWTTLFFGEASGFTLGSGAGLYMNADNGSILWGAVGQREPHTNVNSTPYAVLPTDRELAVKTDVARIVNLEALATAKDGRILIVSDRLGIAPAGAALNPITINPSGAEKINGVAAPAIINWNWGCLWLKADISEGTWRIVGGW